jgi:hypothetical protein
LALASSSGGSVGVVDTFFLFFLLFSSLGFAFFGRKDGLGGMGKGNFSVF